MKGIEIKNFRSLKDTGMLNLSPITILVGKNSSGKSTFFRAFPLIKQLIATFSKVSSGKLLEHATNQLQDDGKVLSLKLDDYLVPHWANLGKKVFTWGCVNEPIRA